MRVVYSATFNEAPVEEDRRYRVMVLLGRSDRPTHYKFHCLRCTARVAELVNAKVLAATDMIDNSGVDTVGIGIRCGGRDFEGTGRRCDIWYYFSVGDNA